MNEPDDRDVATSDATRDGRSDDCGDAVRGDDAARREPQRRVRRTPPELTREERQFLERHRVDQPPHHDSSWG